MTNQSNTNKLKDKEEPHGDDNTEVAFKDAGHCSRNTHNLLLGLTVMGIYTRLHSLSNESASKWRPDVPAFLTPPFCVPSLMFQLYL